MIDFKPLDTKPTGHSRVSYINENSLVLDVFKHHFYSDFQKFIIPKNGFIMNNKQKSNKNCSYKMKQENIQKREEYIITIKSLVNVDSNHLNSKYLGNLKDLKFKYRDAKYFGGWGKAIKAAGLRPITNSWTKDQIIKEIKQIQQHFGYIPHAKDLPQLGYKGLHSGAVSKFGNWGNALALAGFKIMRRRWNKEKVVKELRLLYEKTGKIPNYGELYREGEKGLPQAARKYHGSWVNAMRAAGLKAHRNDYWTKEQLIEELKREVRKIGHVPSGKELKRKGRCDLVSSGSKFFGGYNNYLIAAGFKPVLTPNIWTGDNIKKELHLIAKHLKRTPTERDLVALDKRTLIPATWRQFKGWNNAIEAAGLKANGNFVKDKTWKDWETFVLKLCSSLFPDSEKPKVLPNKTIPDFYEYAKKKIIEVKINAADTTIPSTIRNYSPYCNRIEIWYLTGKPTKTHTNNVVFRGPEYIMSIIKEGKRLMEQFTIMRNHYMQNERKKD